MKGVNVSTGPEGDLFITKSDDWTVVVKHCRLPKYSEPDAVLAAIEFALAPEGYEYLPVGLGRLVHRHNRKVWRLSGPELSAFLNQGSMMLELLPEKELPNPKRGLSVYKLPDGALQISLYDGWIALLPHFPPEMDHYVRLCKGIERGSAHLGFVYFTENNLRYLREVSTQKTWWLSDQALDTIEEDGFTILWPSLRSITPTSDAELLLGIKNRVQALLAEVPLGKIDMVRKSLIDDLTGGSL